MTLHTNPDFKYHFQYSADYVKAIDGDTVDLIVDLGFNVYTKLRFRLYGIDTPERGQAGFNDATAFIHYTLVEAHDITVYSLKTGKYGRWLAIIKADGENVNELLVLHGHAELYYVTDISQLNPSTW
jgi:micrococcal nuclease